MLRRLLNGPMIFMLKVKRGFMGMALKAAREQTAEAAKIGCPACILSESGCLEAENCRLQVFKRRETLIFVEVFRITDRIKALS